MIIHDNSKKVDVSDPLVLNGPCSCGLYSYGRYSHGLYRYGLYGYGQYVWPVWRPECEYVKREQAMLLLRYLKESVVSKKECRFKMLRVHGPLVKALDLLTIQAIDV